MFRRTRQQRAVVCFGAAYALFLAVTLAPALATTTAPHDGMLCVSGPVTAPIELADSPLRVQSDAFQLTTRVLTAALPGAWATLPAAWHPAAPRLPGQYGRVLLGVPIKSPAHAYSSRAPPA